mgnify:CR=1 FL=1
MTDLDPTSKIRLNNGVPMPVLGLGTWGMTGEKCYRAVRTALDMGYRLIDTASLYRNEEEVGRAVRDSGVSREEVFITTKVASWEQGYDGTMAAFKGSLKRLGLDHIDLYLVHWPVAGRSADTWRAMEALLSEGRCRAIGVSNYSIELLKDLAKGATTPPAVNQIEFNPFVFDRELVRYCKENKILVEAYSPLTRGNCLQEKTLLEIAHGYGRSPAQILLRWSLQRGAAVIPKASTVDHLKENFSVFDFELYDGDMDKLDELDTTSCLIDH